MTSADVVIVGGGPAGSYCAKELAERNIDVLVLEKDRFCGEKNVCGGVLNADAIEKHNLQYATQGKLTKVRVYHEDDFLEVPQPRYTFQRSFFDRAISEKAVKAGAEILTQHMMLDFLVKPDSVKIKVKDLKTGRQKIMAAMMIVGADGFASRVRNRINPPFERNDYGVSAQYQIPLQVIENFSIDKDTAYFIFSELYGSSYAWIFPKKEFLTIGIGCRVRELNFDMKRALHSLLKHPLLAGQKVTQRPVYESSPIPDNVPSNLVGDRIILIGDAAGLVKPTSGGGIQYAIESGIEASKVIETVLREGLPPNEETFATYVKNIKYILTQIKKEQRVLKMLKGARFAKLMKIMIQGRHLDAMRFMSGENKFSLGVLKDLIFMTRKYVTK